MFAPKPVPISEVVPEVALEPVKEIKPEIEPIKEIEPKVEPVKEIQPKVEPVVETKPVVIPEPQFKPKPKKKKNEVKKAKKKTVKKNKLKKKKKKEAISQDLINAALKPQQSKPVRQVLRVAKRSTNSKPTRTHTAPRKRTIPKKRVSTHPAPKKKHAPNPQLERQYGWSVKQIIEQQKSYPKRARRMHKQGIVKVGFSLSRSGNISNLRIVKSSGINSLDKAILKAVRKVGRFPAFPAGIAKQSIRYIIPIAYRLN